MLSYFGFKKIYSGLKLWRVGGSLLPRDNSLLFSPLYFGVCALYHKKAALEHTKMTTTAN